ncbi:hypothetical protein HAX54_050033 [Datura stramonium]|uniref:Uncharacterized protein n=1 Tax=Datura stramonium TaxID=4076 RepID=A0ABS8SWN3_DATST|nr:hypothetical protein [Datura stramonium]
MTVIAMDDGAGSSGPTGLFQRMEADLTPMRKLLGPRIKVSPRYVPEYSFFIGGDDEKASDLGKDNNEASS